MLPMRTNESDSLPADVAAPRVGVALAVAALAACLLAVVAASVLALACLAVVLGALFYAWRQLSVHGADTDEDSAVPPVRGDSVAAEALQPPPAAAKPVALSLLGSAGHDLRQPLQAVSLFAATLAAQPLPESSRKLVAGIEAAAQSLSGMNEAIFGLAKLEAGRLSCQRTVLTLDELLDAAVADKLDTAHERQLHLRHVATRHKALADGGLLGKCVDIMLRHALETTTQGGVLLGCRKRGAEVWLEVWDSSPGGAQALTERHFVPGEGYCATLPDRGYGLAYVQGLAQLMSGALVLYSRPGRGNLLRLRLQRVS